MRSTVIEFIPVALMLLLSQLTQAAPMHPDDRTPESLQMKDVVIDAAYVFPDGEHVRGVLMDAALKAYFKPESVDEFFEESVEYYVMDTIAVSDAATMYAILRNDPNEISGWLVIYDPGMQVSHQLEVYYENAEGNFYLTSEVRDNIITTTGDNITPEERPSSRFRVDGLRFQLIE